MEALTLVSPLASGRGFGPGDLVDMNCVLPATVSCFLRCDYIRGTTSRVLGGFFHVGGASDFKGSTHAGGCCRDEKYKFR